MYSYVCGHVGDEGKDATNESRDGQDPGQDGQDETREGQDKSQDGQDKRLFWRAGGVHTLVLERSKRKPCRHLGNEVMYRYFSIHVLDEAKDGPNEAQDGPDQGQDGPHEGTEVTYTYIYTHTLVTHTYL